MSTDCGTKKEISQVFPYKNPDGSPAFWHYQKDVIEKSFEAFGRGKRCVVIDAPVGSGKSVINYTILKCQGPAVYITAQKTLQDQIDNEDWPGVKSVKGRNAYICNYAATLGKTCGCDLKGDDWGSTKTCKEVKKYNYQVGNKSYTQLIDSILDTLSKTGSDRSLRRSRTSFSNSKEVFDTVQKVSTITPPGKDPQDIFIKQTACNLHPCECPVKSARLMARFSDIAVVNPDAYYSLNKTMQLFEGRKHMVIDEAHRLDDAVQRMFRQNIPIGIFKECFGINLNDVATLTSIEEFCQKFKTIFLTEIWPLIAAIKTASDIEDCFYVHDLKSCNDHNFKNKEVESICHKIISKCANDENVSFTKIFVDAISKEELRDVRFVELYDMVRTIYTERCEGFKCSDIFDINTNISRIMPLLKKQEKVVLHLIKHIDTLEGIVYVLDGMVRAKYGENRVFIKQLLQTTKKKACEGDLSAFFEYYKDNESVEVVLDLVPLHIGCLLQGIIFKGMETIILSSGTWVAPGSMLAGYGFKKEEVEVLRIQPIFPAKNRPIYVCSDPKWTDFSEKIEGRDVTYFYQSAEGARKFNKELYKTISYIRQKHGQKTNIAVHCANYGISKLIAQYYPAIDDTFLIHLPRIKEVENAINGHTTFRQEKSLILHRFCDNPGTGLTLVSPSILEGLDFKNDICRAQIILKAPIPNLGDPFVYHKFFGCKEINLRPDPMFLDVKCAVDLNQAYGRNVRGMDDWGETYVTDLALTKRLAKALKVSTPGIDNNAPGNMGKLCLTYIKQGVVVSSDEYGRFLFKWPI